MANVHSPVRAIAAAVGVALSGFGAGLVLTLAAVVAITSLEISLSETEAVVTGLVLLQGIAFPTVALVYLRLRDRPLSYVGVRLPTLRDLGWVVGGYVLAFGLVVGFAIALTGLGAPTADRSDAGMLTNPSVLLLLVPLSFLLIGPGEELLFRGIIQSRLRETFGPATSIVLASAMFAPAHVTALVGSPAALAVSISVLFVPSLVFGAAYERTGNIVVPSLIHGAYNATLFGLLYVALRFGDVDPEAAGGVLRIVGFL